MNEKLPAPPEGLPCRLLAVAPASEEGRSASSSCSGPSVVALLVRRVHALELLRVALRGVLDRLARGGLLLLQHGLVLAEHALQLQRLRLARALALDEVGVVGQGLAPK